MTKTVRTDIGKRVLVERYRIDRLRVRHLRLLDFVHRTRSLRRAAEEIGVSQPAASVLLREIETAFGASLVVRTPRGCYLSKAGEDALGRLTIALAAVDLAIEAARAPMLEPPLRLGLVQLAGTTILPKALARLERNSEFFRIEVRESRADELMKDLAAGSLDGVVGWVDPESIDQVPLDRLRIKPLWRGRMEVVASVRHPLARKRTVRPQELAECHWVVAHRGTRMRAAFTRLFARAGVPEPPAAVTCSAVHSAIAMVGETQLLAMAPDVLVAQYARHMRICAIRGSALDTGESSVSFITRRDSDGLPALRRLEKAMLEAADVDN